MLTGGTCRWVPLPSGPRPLRRRRCLATTDEACAALLLVLEAGNGLEDDDPSLKGFGYYSKSPEGGTALAGVRACLAGLTQRPGVERQAVG